MHFESLNIIEPILKSIERRGLHNTNTNTDSGYSDCSSGNRSYRMCPDRTGKTAAFAVPILQILTAANHLTTRKKSKPDCYSYQGTCNTDRREF